MWAVRYCKPWLSRRLNRPIPIPSTLKMTSAVMQTKGAYMAPINYRGHDCQPLRLTNCTCNTIPNHTPNTGWLITFHKATVLAVTMVNEITYSRMHCRVWQMDRQTNKQTDTNRKVIIGPASTLRVLADKKTIMSESMLHPYREYAGSTWNASPCMPASGPTPSQALIVQK